METLTWAGGLRRTGPQAGDVLKKVARKRAGFGECFRIPPCTKILFVRGEAIIHGLPGCGFGKLSVFVGKHGRELAVLENVLADVLDEHYMG